MRFSRHVSLILILLVSGSCGILGNKKDREYTVAFGTNTNCLNDVGDKFKSFFDGTIQESELIQVWDCTINAHETFRNYVKGTGKEGSYTVDDIHSFINKVLMTDKPVTRGFVKRTFELKSSLYGNGSDRIQKSDLVAMINLMKAFRAQTLAVLPFIQKFKHDSSAANTSLLAKEIVVAAEHIVKALSTAERTAFKEESAKNLVTELNFSMGINIPEAWVSRIFKANGAIMNHDTSYIAAQDWAELIRLAAPAISFNVASTIGSHERIHTDDEYLGLLLEISRHAREALTRVFAKTGNGISTLRLKEFIDKAPDEWLPIKDRKTIHKTLTVAVKKLFKGQPAGTSAEPDVLLNQDGIQLAYSIFEKFVNGKTMIRHIVDLHRLDPDQFTNDQFAEAARNTLSTMTSQSDRNVVDRLLGLSMVHRPHFTPGNNHMTFDYNLKNSVANLEINHWTGIVGEHLMESYSKEKTKEHATLADIQEVFADYGAFGQDMEFIDRTLPRWDERRFREADLFVYSSNGDDVIDVAEITDLLMFIVSVSDGTSAIKRDIELVCEGTSMVNDVKDPLGWLWMDPACFQKEYFSKSDSLWMMAPALQTFYKNLQATQKSEFERFANMGARRCMNNLDNNPIGGLDSSSYMGILHYMEALLMRFDANHDGKFDTDESVDLAFPAFRKFLANEANMNIKDPKLPSLFAWLIKHGGPPTSIFDKLAFLRWHNAGRNSWNLSADRLQLYRIISQFAVPEANDTYKKYCKQ